MGCAIPSPKNEIWIGLRSNLIKNVLDRDLRHITRSIWTKFTSRYFFLWWESWIRFWLLSTAVSQSTIDCCTFLVIHVKMRIRKLNNFYNFPWVFIRCNQFINLIDVALSISWLSGQDLIQVLIEVHCSVTVNILANSCYVLTEVLWSKNKLLHRMQKWVCFQVIPKNSSGLEKPFGKISHGWASKMLVQLAQSHLTSCAPEWK